MVMETDTFKKVKKTGQIIRVVKDRENPYAMILKEITENSALTYKARGIMAYLMGKPNDWSVLVQDLVNQCPDGEKSVRSGLNELKRFGYYQRYPVYDKKNKICEWESIVTERPVPENERVWYKRKIDDDGFGIVYEVFYLYQKDNEKSNNTPHCPLTENKTEEPNPSCSPSSDNNNTELAHTSEQISLPMDFQKNENLEGRLEDIFAEINWSVLDDQKVDKDIVDAMKQSIINMYFNHNGIKVNGNHIPASIVRKTLSKIDENKLIYVAEQFSEITREKQISQQSAYLASMLYNSIVNEPLAIKAQSNYSLFGAGRNSTDSRD